MYLEPRAGSLLSNSKAIDCCFASMPEPSQESESYESLFKDTKFEVQAAATGIETDTYYRGSEAYPYCHIHFATLNTDRTRGDATLEGWIPQDVCTMLRRGLREGKKFKITLEPNFED